jgi:hypothetical protein
MGIISHSVPEFYEILAHFGQYGPIYQRVAACWKTDAEALVEIRAFDEDLEEYAIISYLLRH